MSTHLSILNKTLTASLSIVSTSCIDASGRPSSNNPFFKLLAIAELVLNASEPPLNIQAFPDLRHKAAASAVTFGLDS